MHFVQYLKCARTTRKQSLDFQTKFINVINYFVVVIERTGSMCAPLLHCILQIVYITTAHFSDTAMNKLVIETNSAVLSCQFWHAVYSRHWEEILCTLAETGHKRLQKLLRNLPQRWFRNLVNRLTHIFLFSFAKVWLVITLLKLIFVLHFTC